MLKDQLQADLKSAMKSGNTSERDALRLLLSELTAAEKAEGKTLDQAASTQVVTRLVKRTNNSIDEYRRLGAADTVAKLENELAVYRKYAPEALADEQVAAIVAEAVAVSGAAGPQDMGKVMKLVMPRVQGRADGNTVQRLVKEALAK